MTSLRQVFHRLPVATVDKLTDDSAAVTFAVPDELRTEFAFRPGQSLTLRRIVDGRDERRSYSICAPAGAAPRIGVRAVSNGVMSTWLVNDLRAGDEVEVAGPTGSFTPDLAKPGHHVLIAAGSGITPMLSIAASVLDRPDTPEGSLRPEHENQVTMLYGNRRSDTVMFADEVSDLKDAHPTRLRLVHVLSREAQEVELFSGRLDAVKLRELLPVTCAVDAVDHWWLCGPFGMVTDAIEVLAELGVPADRVHRELFYVEDTPPPMDKHVEAAPDGPGTETTVILDGRATTLTLPPGSTVLDGAQRVRPDLPFACKGGVCGTCRAKLVDGEVTMRRNFALEAAEVEAGFVLTCQSLPVSDSVTVDFDQ